MRRPDAGTRWQQRQMLTLAERLPCDRFAVEFIVLGDRTTNAAAAEALGVPVHVLGSARRSGAPLPLFAARSVGRAAAYVRLVRRRRYDIVDAWLYPAYVLAAVTRPVTRVPVLVAGRRSLSSFKARFGPLEQAADALARRWSDAIVANSQAVVDDVAARARAGPATAHPQRGRGGGPDQRTAIRAGGLGPMRSSSVVSPTTDRARDSRRSSSSRPSCDRSPHRPATCWSARVPGGPSSSDSWRDST